MDDRLDIVFDGECGFCTRAANWLIAKDPQRRLALHPLQRAGVLERFELTTVDVSSSVWAFERVSGAARPRRIRGAAAIMRAIDVARGGRSMERIMRIPGVRWLAERVYRWVAAHRSRLRGVTPWCAEHPEDCAGFGARPGGASAAA